MMSGWADSRQTLALQDAASNIGSSIQQVYFALEHATIEAGTLVTKFNVPPLIEGYTYRGNATLRAVLDPSADPNQILEIYLKFRGSSISATASVTLGQNVEWSDSTFLSNSTEACLTAEKFANGTILLSFGV